MTYRKLAAVLAATVLGAALIAAPALARGGGGHGGGAHAGGGSHGGGVSRGFSGRIGGGSIGVARVGGWRAVGVDIGRGHVVAHRAFIPHHRTHHRHFARSFVGYGLYADYSCRRWVPTPYGLRLVWTCNYPYGYLSNY
jgi:hypothetical protein